MDKELIHELTMFYIKLPDKASNVDSPKSLLKLYDETKAEFESLLATKSTKTVVKNPRKHGVISHGIDL